MPSGGTEEITRKCDCRSPSQSSAAKMELTSRNSRPISSATCRSSLGKTRLTELIKQVYLLGSGKPTFPSGVSCTTAALSDPPTSPTSSSPRMVADLLGCGPGGDRPSSTPSPRSSPTTCRPSPPPAATGSAARPRSAARRSPFRMFVKHIQTLVPAPVLPVRAAGAPRGAGRGERPLAHRGARLPLRPRRPAARRALHAPRTRRLRPRRGVQRRLAGGGARSSPASGTSRAIAARPGCSAGTPPAPA